MARTFLNNASAHACADGTTGWDLTTTQGTPTTHTWAANSATPIETDTYDITVGAAGHTGNWTVSVSINTITTNTTVRWRLQRLNSSCAVQDSSGYGSSHSTVGVKVDTIAFSPTWAAGDVLRISIEVNRTADHGTKTVTPDVNDADTFVQPISAPTFDLIGFRGRTQERDPSGVNTAFHSLDAAQNTNFNMCIGELYRFRFLIEQTNAAAENHADMTTNFKVQFNSTQAPGWVDVETVGSGAEECEFISATGFADGDNTTQLLGSGTFVTGDSMETATPSDDVTFTELSVTETEIEIAVQLVISEVFPGDTYNFRLLYSANDASPPATVMGNTFEPAEHSFTCGESLVRSDRRARFAAHLRA